MAVRVTAMDFLLNLVFIVYWFLKLRNKVKQKQKQKNLRVY